MAKFCDICNQKIGFVSFSLKANNGTICNDCFNTYLKKTGDMRDQAIQDLKCMSIQQIRNVLNSISENERMLSIFSPNKNIAGLLEIDEKNKLWGVPTQVGFTKKIQKVYSFEDVIGYDTDENKEVVAKRKGTLGRSIVGGVLFGGVGALIGGATSKNVTQEKITSINIQIKVKSSYTPILIVVPNNVAKQNVITAIENMMAQASKNRLNSSVADELLKYKQLLDSGIITPHEFLEKKKQILNL